jgi:hypothetical protein
MSKITITPEIAAAFRKAVAQRVRYWDATYELEVLIGAEISDDVFADVAVACDIPEEADNLNEEEIAVYLEGAVITAQPVEAA